MKELIVKREQSMLRFMNSAMMPQPGVYNCQRITSAQFSNLANQNKSNGFKSYIGYANTAQLLSGLCGFNIPVCRDSTTLENYDIILVAKLGYRVNPNEKGKKIHGDKLGDYEFFLVEYNAPRK